MASENTNTNDASRTAGRTPAQQPPSAEQMLSARRAHWHQDEKPLLSLEALRDWLNRSGLVLYTPRTQPLGAPAPTLVEAVLGKANGAPDLAEMEAARSLLARLIAEGSAVPLNLLGATGATGTDVPDFVVSAAVFSYIFTLRGNKAWKQAPVTSGPVKVSPLSLAAYEMLSAKVTLSVYDLTTQLGKEVTETAVLRALTELWSQLRVIPVPQTDGSATLWELTTARFTKQIKSGANAGQPTALSALISLYLGQAIGATEDEIETFLSPLAPRSRVRDVIHALLSARQLETVVLDGKTLLHVAGEMPGFAAVATLEPAAAPTSEGEPASRISRFAAKPGSKIGTGLRSKPSFGRKSASSEKPPAGRSAYGKPSFGAERERRPFNREKSGEVARPTFNRPWEEEKEARLAASADAGQSSAGGSSTEEESAPRPFSPGASASPGGRGRESKFGAPPRSGGARAGSGSRGDAGGDHRPPRDFAARPGSGERNERPAGPGARKTFSKPGTFGRKREGFGGKPAFGAGEGRPPRREFGGQGAEGRPPRREFNAGSGERSQRPAPGGFKRPGSYSPRSRPEAPAGKPGFGGKASSGREARGGTEQAGEAPRRVFRKFDAPRDKKPFAGKASGGRTSTPGATARPPRTSDGPRSFDKPRQARSDRPRPDRPHPDRLGPDRPRPDRPRPDRPRPDRTGSGGAGSDRSSSSRTGPDRSGYAAGPGGAGSRKPLSKSANFARGGGPFAKFAAGKKPFRKPGPGNSTGRTGGSSGGFDPTRRKRPEENE